LLREFYVSPKSLHPDRKNTMRCLLLALALTLASLLFACDGPIDSDAIAPDDPAIATLALSAGDGVVRDGTVTDITADGGELTDDLTGEPRRFDARAADVVLEVGDKVIYIHITTPRGNEIVKSVIKR